MLKPVSEEDCERSDTEAGDTRPDDRSKKKVELKETRDLRTEEKAEAGQKDTGQDRLPGADTIHQSPGDRRHDHVKKHGDRLGGGCFRSTPVKVVDERNEEDGERGANAEPEGHGDHRQADNHPAVK
jgi:hypothetical protein